MKDLHAYELDYKRTFTWVYNNLVNVNALSTQLLQEIDFTNGSFTTLLPEGSDLEKLYNFEEGFILPQGDENIYQNKPGTYSVIPSIDDELASILYNLLKSNKSLSCIFDDVLRLPSDRPISDLRTSHGKVYQNQCYYVIDNTNLSEEKVKECLLASSSGWHSLCIMTALENLSVSSDLTVESMQSICKYAQLIIIGAYDFEGYIFWHTKNFNNWVKQ